MTAPLVVREPSHVGLPSDSEVTATVRLAKALVESGMMPKGVNTPAKAVALMLTGKEMGLGPMASIRSISIVDGKPVVAADLQLGLFKRAGGQSRFDRLDHQGATLWVRHPNGDEHTESFMKPDAESAGLLGKDNWKKYPKAMYRSRVITAALKSVGFEPMAGVYDPEELTPDVPVTEPPAPEAPKMIAAPAEPVVEEGRAPEPAEAEPVEA